MIERLLIANRAEIAVRVARGAREMGISPVGIFSEADRNAMHLDYMEDAVCIGAAQASESYLNIEAVIGAAKALGADGVHPGYGFLSERAAFAQAVGDAGMIFVGPSPAAMAAMGSKREAKMRVREFDVPVVPGYDGDDQDPKKLRTQAARIGAPLLIKASAGGGGRGMRVVDDLKKFDEALQAAQREAQSAFGDDTVLLERYLKRPRHIEFQVLADTHGNTIHFGERECSIQRRHQKIIEEAPSVAVSPELRATMGAAAVRAAKSVNYTNAGTVEFMLDEEGHFYFLEMNTRLQVEHPVTEMAYGVDLVHWQLRIANGERLNISQDSVEPRWWSIESRIYAEDPYNKMLPSTGTITQWDAPQQAPGVRLDSGVRRGSDVPVYYDPMLAKLIVFGTDRATAIYRMEVALREFAVGGVRTNIPLLEAIFCDPQFRAGETTTQFLEEWLKAHSFERAAPDSEQLRAAVATKLKNGPPFRIGGVGIPFYLTDGHAEYALTASRAGARWRVTGDAQGELDLDKTKNAPPDVEFALPPDIERTSHGGPAHSGRILSPMPGKIVKVSVNAGDSVDAHALLVVLEAMKMEHRIEAPSAGAIGAIHVKEGDIVGGAAPLLDLQ